MNKSLNNFFHHKPLVLARQSTPADIRKTDVGACLLTPLDPGGEVHGCSVDCTLDMSNVSRVLAAEGLKCSNVASKSKQGIFKPVWFGCGGISGNLAAVGREKSSFLGVLIDPKSSFRFTLLHLNMIFFPHTAACCCKRQQRQMTYRA